MFNNARDRNAGGRKLMSKENDVTVMRTDDWIAD